MRINLRSFDARRFLTVFAFCELLMFGVVFTTACGAGLTTLLNTIQAVIGSIPAILAALASSGIISAADAQAGETIATDAGQSVTVFTNAVTAYEQNDTTGAVADAENALSVASSYLPQLTSWASGKAAQVVAWASGLVSVLSNAFTAIANDIKPAAAAVAKGFATGDWETAKQYDAKAMDAAKQLRADYESLLDSNLPTEAASAGKTFVAHKLARHIGPVRI